MDAETLSLYFKNTFSRSVSEVLHLASICNGLVSDISSPFLFIRGLSCPSCNQGSLSLNCLKLAIPGFPHNCLPISCGNDGFLKKILGLELAWKSGLKVPFLPLGPSCPLQTFLLSDPVGCDSPLQIVMAFWRTIIVSRGLSHHTRPRSLN